MTTAKTTKRKITSEDVLAWLLTIRDGRYASHPALTRLYQTAKSKNNRSAAVITLLCEQIGLIHEMAQLRDDKTIPREYQKKVTYKLIGELVGRKGDWVSQCVAAQQMIITYGHYAVVRKILDDDRQVLGVQSLLDLLGEAVAKVHNGENAEVEVNGEEDFFGEQ